MSGSCVAAGALYASSERYRSLIAKCATWPLIVAAATLLFGEPFLLHFFPGLPKAEMALTPFLIVFVVFSTYRYRASLERLVMVHLLAMVGVVSYGLYLWQEMFLASPTLYLRHSILEYAPACVLVVVLSYRFVEKPLMRMGARISNKLIERGIADGPSRLRLHLNHRRRLDKCLKCRRKLCFSTRQRDRICAALWSVAGQMAINQD